MSSHVALQPVDLDPTREHLAALELRVAEREHELEALKVELQQLQSRYLAEVGVLYAELSTLEAAVTEAEVRAGLRPPPEEATGDPEGGAQPSLAPGCTNRSAPSDNLKRMFRDVAKAVHPDLALDEPARCRRHSLMAEANRAYAERDEDRLRLILRVWERSPESVLGDDPDANRLRLRRRVAEMEAHFMALDAELADLRASAISRLKTKIDNARAQGWDLFAEMIRQVRSEIASVKVQLARVGSRARVSVRTEGTAQGPRRPRTS